MPLPTMFLLYRFWLTEICICRKPRPTRDEIYKLHSQRRSYFRFFLYFRYSTHETHSCHFSTLSSAILLVTFCLFLSFFVAMKGIHTTSLSHFISLIHSVHHLFFLSSRRRLLNSHKSRLFRLDIQHATHCLFERRTPVGLSEAAVCGFCLSISVQKLISVFAISNSIIKNIQMNKTSQKMQTRRNLSETRRQIHLPGRQRLINQKRH